MYYSHYCVFSQGTESWCDSGFCTFLSVCVNGIATRHEASPIRNPQERAAMTAFLRILFPQCARQTHSRWRREIQMCTIFQADKLTIVLGRRGRKWKTALKRIERRVAWQHGLDSVDSWQDLVILVCVEINVWCPKKINFCSCRRILAS